MSLHEKNGLPDNILFFHEKSILFKYEKKNQ